MDPNTVKDLQDAAKILAPIAGAPAIAELLKRLVGPTVDLFGERMRRFVERSDEMIKEAKATPVYVVPSLCLPLLQAASLAEDETLKEMFAALLANARIPEYRNSVRPSFVSIVSQLAPDEAVLFMRFAALTTTWREVQKSIEKIGHGTKAGATSYAEQKTREATRYHMTELRRVLPDIEGESSDDRESRMHTCFLVLDGLRLIKTDGAVPLMTALGWALFYASTPPKPNS